jgi:hypothetical protein
VAKSTFRWIAALALVAATALARAESAGEPAPEALAQAWFEQLHGGNAIGIWTTEWAGGEIVFGVARRWVDGRPEVFVHIYKPRVYDELNFLLRERAEARLELLYYRSPKLFPRGAKAARVMPTTVPDPLERLPFAEGLPALVDVEPARAAEYRFTRLPDARVANRPCRVIEGRPVAADVGFDVVRYSLASETGVALETAWLRAGELVRRVEVDPSAVRDYDGRFLPTRTTVERPGNSTQVFSLSTLRLDPPLPDQLFTTQNLKLGRFPSY